MAEQVIEVRIWNQSVGAIAADPVAGCYVFEYTPAWIKKGIQLSPLMMPATDPNTGRPSAPFLFPTLSKDTFKGLPGMLADGLPDDFGNALIDAWMAKEGIDKRNVTTLDRLAYMGRRGMGALEFKPSRGSHTESSKPLEMKAMVEAARDVLHGDLSGDVHAQVALANIIRVGTSAGGARAKAVVAWNPETNELRSGQFDCEQGFEHWLLKFDGVGTDKELGTGSGYGRIEYAYHLMAVAAGVEMSECRLLRENGRAHFMTRRFDRDNNVKHHLQTLGAMYHLDYRQRATHAYEQLFQVISLLGLGDQARKQAFLRMCLNVVASNCDDHVKNHSFRLRKGQGWELAPAYDITHAFNPKGEWTYQHLMSVNGRFQDVSRRDLLTVAERGMVPGAAALIDQVTAALDGWAEFAHKAEIPAPDVARIEADFQRV